MARVPEYGDAPLVDPAPLRATRQRTMGSAQTLGTGAREIGAVGEAVQRTGDLMQVRAIEFQRRENADMVQRADAAVTEEYLSFESEAKQRRGRDAVGLTKETGEWFAEAEKRHAEALGNDTQRQIFGQQLQRLRQSALGQVSNYEAAESRRSFVESANANIVAKTNAAAANPNDIPGLAALSDDIDATLAGVAKSEGWTDEQLSVKRGEAMTRFHTAVIAAQLDTNPRAAKDYYDANKDEIDGTARAKLEQQVEIGSIKVRSQEATDEIESMGLSTSAALDYIQQNYEGEMEDAVTTRFLQRRNQDEAALNEQKRAASDAAWNAYDQGGIDAVTNSMWVAMDPEARVRMREYARQRAESNAGVTTDWSMYDAQVQMATERPDEFIAQDINALRPYLGEREFSEMVTLRKKMVTNGLTPPDVLTAGQIMSPLFSQLGLVGDKNAPARGELTALSQQALTAARSANPDKPLGDAEETRIVERTIMNAILERPEHFAAQGGEVGKVQTFTQQQAAAVGLMADKYKSKRLKVATGLFKTVSSEVIRRAQERQGGALNEDQRQAILNRLMQFGEVEESGINRKGYFFEFANDPEAVKNFVPEEP